MATQRKRRPGASATVAADSSPQPPAEEAADTTTSEVPASEPDAGSSAAAPAPPSALARWLPWGLVAALAIGCVLLATMYGNATDRLRALESATASATRSPSPGAAPFTAQPTTGASAAPLLQLQRRQANDPRALGKADAPIVLIEWSDYRCPFCAAWYKQTLPAIIPYIKSGSVRIEYHDFVIFGDESAVAARAARAAGLQNHFWDYSDLLWNLHTGNGQHPEITDQMLQDLASKAGVPDVAKFNQDRNSQAVIDAVTADTDQATKLGLTATPFFLINTTQIPGAYPASAFTTVIEQYGGKPAA